MTEGGAVLSFMVLGYLPEFKGAIAFVATSKVHSNPKTVSSLSGNSVGS